MTSLVYTVVFSQFIVCSIFILMVITISVWVLFNVKSGNVIDVVMNGYPGMVKNHFVVLNVRVCIGIHQNKKRR